MPLTPALVDCAAHIPYNEGINLWCEVHMGRVNVIGIMTNITPEQMEVVTNLCAKLDIKPAQLVRMALAVYCEANGETWPPAHIVPGGNRRKREKLVT